VTIGGAGVMLPTKERIVTIAGREHGRLVSVQKLVVRPAQQPVRLVRFACQTLRRKLKWGSGGAGVELRCLMVYVVGENVGRGAPE
jgi:hypothetical protein